jgi:hypothetical protein
VGYIILLYNFELLNTDVDKIFSLVGYDFTSMGNWFLIVQGNVMVLNGNQLPGGMASLRRWLDT